ncbi:MAG TPA: phosphatidate cytidylyltransferase, partial [Acidobacteriota bacterium]|nr:phosphatidate cytidylyltransferase [Acidobacteriota bacterium]
MNTAPSDKAELEYTAEVWRKLLHLFALSIPIGYHLVDRSIAVAVVFVAFSVSLTIDLGRFRGWPIQRFWRRFT